MKTPVTIVQIAKESGVSIATVSRVINGTAPVAPATRERVNAVIKKHHYTPNALARGLINRQSMTIGITIRWGLLFWLTLGFSTVTYFNSVLLKKTFDKLIEHDTTDNE